MMMPAMLLFAASLLPGGQPVSLTLPQAVEMALRQNPAVLAAQHAVEQADARIKQARADYLPQVGFNGIAKAGLSGATNQLGLAGLPNSPFYRNFADSLNAYVNVADFGRRKHRVEMLRWQRRAAEAELQRVEAAVISQTEHAFYELLRAEKLGDAAREVLVTREATLRQARAFYEAQLRSRVEVQLAEVGLARARLQLLQAGNGARTAAAALGHALGVAQDATYQLVPPDLSAPRLDPLESLIEQAYRLRPDLLEARAEREAAAAKVELARSQKRPVLALAFAGGYARFAELLARQLTAGGAGLILPVFTGGRLTGLVEEAEGELRATESRGEELKQEAAFEVRAAHIRLQNAIDSLPMRRLQVEAARQAVRLAFERYKERLGSLVELNQAQAGLAEATADEAIGSYDVKLAESDLRYAVGLR